MVQFLYRLQRPMLSSGGAFFFLHFRLVLKLHTQTYSSKHLATSEKKAAASAVDLANLRFIRSQPPLVRVPPLQLENTRTVFSIILASFPNQGSIPSLVKPHL
ncbi:hypothetical protein CAOG_010087 [Capsaspora owczarzaki ATCC 30864]|uniref:Uncharacterized protein n=1 Tax=Capsaspora owczarzaki (strain ATCC 30864) TaxID=595528 RepID=A0A0D2UQ82_CAPO3|nr:hypothetical protein CAOG_010087 [Capsaspora owczarzaki ATCC 30864]